MQQHLDLIEKMFLSVTKNKKLVLSCLKNEALKSLDVDIQDAILDVTVKNPLCSLYAPPISYQNFFLRCLYECVENFGAECSDNLAKAYTDILMVNDADDIGHHSYKIDNNCTITLRENSYFVAKSTTGLQTWEAAKYLAEWCVANASILEKKIVLELGSGIGLLGITVLKLCSPHKYIFSDKSSEVLDLLNTNIKINSKNIENSEIEQRQLLWADINDDDTKELSPDIILGSDIVFDIEVIGSLIIALKTLMMKEESCAYIASTIRNPETNKIFLEQLGSSGLSYTILRSHQRPIFIHDDSSTFVLYKIFKSLNKDF